MKSSGRDWLRVVYGRGIEGGAGPPPLPGRTEITVRQTPPELDLRSSRSREQRVRVTVVPSRSAQPWTLWLRDFGPRAGEAPGRVWWRVEPGTWQPLGGTRQCVAEGRGRVRLDISLRLDGRPAVSPRLRFVAEPA